MNNSLRNSRPILIAALMSLAVVACKNTSSPSNYSAQYPGRVDLSSDQTATAEVTAVDPAGRFITLREKDGSTLTVQAGPEVRNFDQIRAGDTLRVRYHETLAATLRPNDDTTSPVKGAAVVGSAKPGSAPAGGVGLAATTQVRIKSVDLENDIVVFEMDSGALRKVHAVRPEGREFIRTLKNGDIVQLDYKSSMALTIEKM
jgi:hypothetical protein